MIQRGEIYFVDLNPIKGREQSGSRPVLVLSSDTIAVITVPESAIEPLTENEIFNVRSLVAA